MSNHDNGRRGEKKRTEHGPRWEGGGSDNSAVARARKKWKRIRARKFRRTDNTSGCRKGAGNSSVFPKAPLMEQD